MWDRCVVLADLNITIDGHNITAAAFLNTTDSVRTDDIVRALLQRLLSLAGVYPLLPYL